MFCLKFVFLMAAAVAAADVHPVDKVIALLKDLGQKAKAEGKQEEVSYTTFSHWCARSTQNLNEAITAEKSTLESLDEVIASHTGNIKVLEAEVGQLEKDLGELGQAATAAERERKAGSDLYTANKDSLEQTIKAIKQAVALLEQTRTSTDTGLLEARSGVRSLLSLVSYKASAEENHMLQAFAGEPERPDIEAKGDYDAHVKGYDFKSDSVIELLKHLSLKFEDELTAANTAETHAASAYQLAKQASDNLVKAKEGSKKVKEDENTAAKQHLASTKTSHGSFSADLAADTEALTDTESACEQKRVEWEERSATRAKEIAAIETAISILSKVTGVRTSAPGNPVPPPSPVTLLQLTGPKGEQALRILRQEASRAHSKALDHIVDDVETRVKHGDGPFDQVINSIEKLISVLMHEQKEEDDHKNWCDQELSKTQASINDKTSKVTELALKIQEAQAMAAQLAEQALAADEMAARIASHVKEATEIRRIGKEENRLAIKDSQEAQTALANAVAVLKDFYKNSGAIKMEAWEFVQREPVTLPDAPSTWDAGYTSVADPAKQPEGIVTVLEAVSSDFAQMESQTRAQEQSDQEAFEKDMKDCEIEMARRKEESEQKKAEEQRQLEKKRTLEASHKSVQGEKEATEQYLRDLQPACVEGSSTYEARRTARAEEITALKQAQGLLQNAFEEKAPATSFLGKRVLRGSAARHSS